MSIDSMIDRPTPIERRGNLWLKRDDLYRVAGVCGGKARACWELSQGAVGLVTGSVRRSPQQQIVSRVAYELKVPCRIHTATGSYTEEMEYAKSYGAKIFQHKMGYSGVLAARARNDAAEMKYTHIPFGMESYVAVQCTRRQVKGLPDCKRIVITLGSGISCAGLLWGLHDLGLRIPVVGIRVGGGQHGNSIIRRLDKFAPKNWRLRMEIVKASVPYEKPVEAELSGLRLDSHYESKCAEFLRDDDLFWIVGIRSE